MYRNSLELEIEISKILKGVLYNEKNRAEMRNPQKDDNFVIHKAILKPHKPRDYLASQLFIASWAARLL